MATIDLGKIKFVFRGTYAGGTAYVPDDVVTFTDGSVTSSYICTTATTGNNPSSGGTVHGSWAFLAKGQATSPTTTQGDIIVRGASADTRLAIGAAGKALLVNASGNGLEYGGAGITMAQTWRLTSSFSIPSSNTFLTSNFEVADTYSYGSIGASMTESSGVFTFPSTGIYLIQLIGQHNTSGQINWSQTEIHITTDNGTYNGAAYGYANLTGSGAYQSSICQIQFDVTNTSTHKIKFGCRGSNGNSDFVGGTNNNNTIFQFIRLGDT